jgi:hypothetical protein
MKAHDLWSWLPSRAVAEKYHGDNALEHCPSNRDVMTEASMYLGHLKHPDAALTPEEQEWFTRCPCGDGDSHVESSRSRAKEDAP